MVIKGDIPLCIVQSYGMHIPSYPAAGVVVVDGVVVTAVVAEVVAAIIQRYNYHNK